MKANLIAGVLLLIFAAGCGKPDQSDPSSPLVKTAPVETATPTGGKTLTASGISLTFPDDWKTVNMSQGEFEQSVKALEKNPNGAEMARIAKTMSASGMVKMFAFDPKSSKPGFMNNANLIVQEGVGKATIDQALDSSKKQIEAMGATCTTSKVSFPAGEFGRMESRLKGPNGEYVAIGYLKVDNGNLDVVTFSCKPDQVKPFDAAAQEIMKTFSQK